ncbi:MAG: molybdopterin cofactor-binding domain-containing protein [Chloroflexota bacterium]
MTDSTTQTTAQTEQQTEAQPAEKSTKKRRWRMTRRGFLIGTGVVGLGVALGFPFAKPIMHLRVAEMFDSPDLADNFMSYDAEPPVWFEILPDSKIRVYIIKAEMGQGVHTSLAQFAVEEFGVNWDDIEVTQASSLSGPGADNTGGSWSVPTLYTPMRQAAATYREMLKAEAANILGESIDNLVLQDRAIMVDGNSSKSVTLWDLVNSKEEWDVPEEPAALKPASEFTVIGQSIPRVDIPDKVTGKAIYGYDMHLPGMLYGAVARPPTIEATMTNVYPNKAREMPGVVDLAYDLEAGFAGVVATSRAEARAAVDSMIVRWNEGKLWQQEELDEIVTVGNGTGIVVQSEGDTPAMLRNATSLEAEYRTPFAVHAALEPQASLADVQGDRVNIWSSTQSPDVVANEVSALLEIPFENVEVTPTYLGGGFGRKLNMESAIEAVRLSKAAGVPVHVGWDRTESMRYGYFRPPTHSKLLASLDDQGKITAIEHRQASGDVAFPFMPPMFEFMMGADFGAYRGAKVRYDAIPNRQTTAWRTEVPVRTGWWRGLGLLANTFALESFMDELAHMAGADPLQFRLDHLGDSDWAKRMGAVLEAAAELGDWGVSVAEGRARGIACSTDVDTVVAMVAEVSVDEGQLRVHKVSTAMDCGMTVNPDGAIAQVQGSVIWGIGSVLMEKMQIKDGRVDIDNFDGYPLATMRDAPEMAVTLLEADDRKPRGVGEPPMGPVGAAIANGLFSLTGNRVRNLPFAPEEIG